MLITQQKFQINTGIQILFPARRTVRLFRITLQPKQAGSRIFTGSREVEDLFNSLVRFQNVYIMNAAEIIFMEFNRYVVTFQYY